MVALCTLLISFKLRIKIEEYYYFVCVCVCVCVHMHAHVEGGQLWGGMFVCCSFWCNIVSNHSVVCPWVYNSKLHDL